MYSLSVCLVAYEFEGVSGGTLLGLTATATVLSYTMGTDSNINSSNNSNSNTRGSVSQLSLMHPSVTNITIPGTSSSK